MPSKSAPNPISGNPIRSLAQKLLSDSIRKPLGRAWGHFDGWVMRWVRGAVFDLLGGRFRADGCEFVIPRDITSRAYRSCFIEGSYEMEERELIRAFVRPDDSVLELGACLGIVSCVTNKLLSNPTKHVVVEGNPFCIPTIHRNRGINQCGFLIENAAVSNQPDAIFYLHPVYVVGGTTQRKSDLPVRVPTRSLADLDLRLGPFSTLIIDIEGSELEVFSSSRDQLARYRLVIVELHEWAIGKEGVDRCREILAASGLTFRKCVGITEAWQRD